MPEKLRCAVIGAGGIGLEHLQSLSLCPRATAVALAENHPQRARDAAHRFHLARSFSDYRELLEEPDIDAVTIALPNHLHAPVAIAALQARKHVLLEKPMATSAREAAAILDAAKKAKRTLMVAQNLRFHRHTQTAKLFMERGDLGEVYHARCFWRRRAGIPRIGSWFTQKKLAGGGCFADIGVHLLDACFHLLKEFEVRSVSAQTFAKFGPRGLGEMEWGRSEVALAKPFDVEDYGVALLRMASGRSVLFEIGWAGFHPPDEREQGIDLLGTNAGLSLFPPRLFRNGANGYEATHLNALKVPHSENPIPHWVGCVLDGKKPLVAPEESLKIQQILDAIYAAAANGREVRLK